MLLRMHSFNTYDFFIDVFVFALADNFKNLALKFIARITCEATSAALQSGEVLLGGRIE